MIQLHDSITVRSTRVGSGRPDDMTVPAHVYTVSGSNPREPLRLGLMVSELRAMVGPLPRQIEPGTDRIVHDGLEYHVDGPPMGRYRRGRLHHWTINLRRATG